jgi:hypothetical protein
MNAANKAELSVMRERVRDTKRVATCLEFGPRFLHSTGQAYKGGPATSRCSSSAVAELCARTSRAT